VPSADNFANIYAHQSAALANLEGFEGAAKGANGNQQIPRRRKKRCEMAASRGDQGVVLHIASFEQLPVSTTPCLFSSLLWSGRFFDLQLIKGLL
jgi:hypothetical protein